MLKLSIKIVTFTRRQRETILPTEHFVQGFFESLKGVEAVFPVEGEVCEGGPKGHALDLYFGQPSFYIVQARRTAIEQNAVVDHN